MHFWMFTFGLIDFQNLSDGLSNVYFLSDWFSELIRWISKCLLLFWWISKTYLFYQNVYSHSNGFPEHIIWISVCLLLFWWIARTYLMDFRMFIFVLMDCQTLSNGLSDVYLYSDGFIEHIHWISWCLLLFWWISITCHFYPMGCQMFTLILMDFQNLSDGFPDVYFSSDGFPKPIRWISECLFFSLMDFQNLSDGFPDVYFHSDGSLELIWWILKCLLSFWWISITHLFYPMDFWMFTFVMMDF